VGAVLAGTGHGLGFLNAQAELNGIAPAERRGEVTAAFFCCIYALVAAAVIGSGLLDLRLSLGHSVAAASIVVAVVALAGAAWQALGRRAAVFA
jgi:lipopolysaccharide export LptBFGC system permease protein LptF